MKRTAFNKGADRLFASYDVEPVGGNREVKATHLIKSLIKEPDGQPSLRSLLNEVYWEDSRAIWRRENPAAERLMERLGQLFDVDEDGIPPAPRSVASPPTPAAVPTRLESKRNIVPTTVNPSGPPNSAFIVHGRNSAVKQELEKFLRHVGVNSLGWNKAKQLAESPRPTTLEIVTAGLQNATAVIVLFTPDDEARIKEMFRKDEDGPHETELTGQARQNVIFEAGMALAMAQDRTLLVRCGRTRNISDIDGHNWTTLNNEHSERRLFLNELKKVKLYVNDDEDIMAVGDFPSNL